MSRDKEFEYGRDPYLDSMKIRLSNKILDSDLKPNQVLYDKDIVDLTKQIKDYNND